MLEEHCRIELEAKFVRPGYNLNRLDGCSAELKKIVMNPHFLHREHLFPNFGQDRFHSIVRFDKRSRQFWPGRVWGWKSAAINLSIRSQRQGVEKNER